MTPEGALDMLRAGDGPERLGRFIERQRWFGGRTLGVASVEIDDAVPIHDANGLAVWLVLLTVTDGGGGRDTYHLPLARRLASVAPPLNGGDDAALVGVDTEPDGEVALYDALADPEAVERLWQAIAHGEHHPGATGHVQFEARPGLDTAGHQGCDHVLVRPLGKEQSNSAAVRGDREMLKVFRRVSRGVNPELEMTAALAAHGFESIATPLGVIEYTHQKDGPSLLGIVQPFLHNGTESLALALTSLRDLYAVVEEEDASLAPDERLDPPALDRLVHEQGATFVPEAVRIGQTVAGMHLALASGDLDGDLRPKPATPSTLGAWADSMTADLDRLLASTGPELDELRPHRDRIADRYAALRSLSSGGLCIRVHGDLHLGQLLRTDAGLTVLDFEGEPARPLDERRALSSPLNDVAGLLRSLEYAAARALEDRGGQDDRTSGTLSLAADAWVAVNRHAVWSAYTAGVAGSGLLPDGADALTLRRAYELRKAVYEVGYELGHRPTWVHIPLRFLIENGGGPP